ncbi:MULTISPECIES: NADH-ubiquinone oxidoreductase-F iron-sulfur binding region domain-containing protein [unclassified Adlercreutzia]|uniref:NADH-ubiquinone oxidoreductase-F iron-sulfur binding region domain-containing protein n=1 Tax=unclassified Adlercreutzia TaxID=2636013 RepID=UPI0013E9CE8F|nr:MULTISPECIES: NADH-ubiquinone oxidoreductase-F iron-sulfur binding region domain-containing protein [unclassified Adlercreutzia]
MGNEQVAREAARVAEAGRAAEASWGMADASAALAAQAGRVRVTVGLGSCGIAAGAKDVYAALRQELADADVDVVGVGCMGLCYAEPLVGVSRPGAGSRYFGNVDARQAVEIARLARGCSDGAPGAPDIPGALAGELDMQEALESQVRLVMGESGCIDPRSLEEYRALGGYEALEKALSSSPEEVIALVEASGLRGRGGAGFPTGAKWRQCAQAVEALKAAGGNADDAGGAGSADDAGGAGSADNNAGNADGAGSADSADGAGNADGADGADNAFSLVVMNGDEGDPGAYMNRSLLESNPHRVLEGVIIAAYAVRARRAYLFVRAEYPLACRTLEEAVAQLYAAGVLGERVLGSGFSLDVRVVRGAGAYLNGEETALLRVLEDGVCRPRKRPPYPAEKGLKGRPTCVNNVETLASVPLVVARGAQAYRSVGTSACPGTKLFSVVGDVERCGLAEVPLGTSVGALARGIGRAGEFKAVQIGGPSGGLLPASLADAPIDYESLVELGAIMGSGGFVVIGHDQCVVDMALYFMRFSRDEACGQCCSCLAHAGRCIEILEALTQGSACESQVEELRAAAQAIARSALCGLCGSAANVVLSALRYFPEEFAAHVRGACPGLVCRDLVSYEIDQVRCQGERCCLLTCPGNAIKGRFGKPGNIVGRLCQRCGMCVVSCPYGAVRKVTPAR